MSFISSHWLLWLVILIAGLFISDWLAEKAASAAPGARKNLFTAGLALLLPVILVSLMFLLLFLMGLDVR